MNSSETFQIEDFEYLRQVKPTVTQESPTIDQRKEF